MLVLAPKDARDCLVKPRVDLEVARLFRGEAELNAAVGADKRGLCEAGAIFDRDFQQPFGGRPPAYFAFGRFHGEWPWILSASLNAV